MRSSVASPSSTAASDYTLPPAVIHSNPSCSFTPRGGGGKREKMRHPPSAWSLASYSWSILVLSGQASILLLFWSLPLLHVTGPSKRKWRAAGCLEFHLPTHFLFLFPHRFWPVFVPFLSAMNYELQRDFQLDLSHILSLPFFFSPPRMCRLQGKSEPNVFFTSLKLLTPLSSSDLLACTRVKHFNRISLPLTERKRLFFPPRCFVSVSISWSLPIHRKCTVCREESLNPTLVNCSIPELWPSLCCRVIWGLYNWHTFFRL